MTMESEKGEAGEALTYGRAPGYPPLNTHTLLCGFCLFSFYSNAKYAPGSALVQIGLLSGFS